MPQSHRELGAAAVLWIARGVLLTAVARGSKQFLSSSFGSVGEDRRYCSQRWVAMVAPTSTRRRSWSRLASRRMGGRLPAQRRGQAVQWNRRCARPRASLRCELSARGTVTQRISSSSSRSASCRRNPPVPRALPVSHDSILATGARLAAALRRAHGRRAP